MNRPALRTVAALGLAAGAIGSVTVASAANVAITPAPLTAYAGLGGSGAPTVYAADNFAGVNNTSLDGRTLATGGGTWDVISGTWRLNGAGGVTGSNSTTSRIVTDAGEGDTRTTVTINDGSGGDRRSGIILRANAAATAMLLVEQDSSVNPDVVRLSGINPWVGEQVIASAPVTLTAPATMTVQAVGPTITVSYNGTPVLTYTLNWVEAALYSQGTYHGVFNRNTGTNNTVLFSDLRVESPT